MNRILLLKTGPKTNRVLFPDQRESRENRFFHRWLSIYGEDSGNYRFLKEQFNFMEEGIRDVRIHDNTFSVWESLGWPISLPLT